MGNTVQLLKDGQPVFPVTDVSLVMGLQDAIKLPPVKVATLPTASADTAGKMYYVGPDGNDEYERYITSAVSGPNTVCKENLQTARDGKNYLTKFFNL